MDYYYKYYPASPIIQNSSSISTTYSIINGDNNNIIPTVKHKRSRSSTASNNVKRSPPSIMRLSTDPQSVAARERRHRISDRFKTLQSLVPGGAKMDTVSMLDEAIHYVKFLKTQIDWLHQNMVNVVDRDDVIVDRVVIPSYHHHGCLCQAQGATTSYGYFNYNYYNTNSNLAEAMELGACFHGDHP